jgi:hypothetical protein
MGDETGRGANTRIIIIDPDVNEKKNVSDGSSS